MLKTEVTRRVVVGNAVAGVALVGPLAVIGGSAVMADKKAPVSKTPTPLTAKGGLTEADQWQNAVGQKFTLWTGSATLTAKLASAERQPYSGPRPAALRREPLLLTFAIDARANPIGDVIYQLDRSVAGMMQMFLQKRVGTSGTAVMTALLN